MSDSKMATTANNPHQQWNLCLQSRELGRKIVSVSSNMSMAELYQIAEQHFPSAPNSTKKKNKPKATKSKKNNSSSNNNNRPQLILKGGGFPPKTLPRDNTVPISTVVSNQERLQIEFGLLLSQGASLSSSSSSSRSTTINNASNGASSSAATTAAAGNVASTTPRRTTQRAAAKAATEAMPEVIKAQEAMMKEQQKHKRSSGTNNSSFTKRRPNTASSTASSSPTKRVKLSASAGAGRRLGDGATVALPNAARSRATAAASAASNRRSKSSRTPSTNTTTTDISEALMTSLKDPGKMGTILRKGMKNAVQASYETSKAFSRLSSIQARSYQMTTTTITANANTASGSGSSNKLKIIFQGTVDKTRVEEIVDLIPQDVLATVIRGIYDSGSVVVGFNNDHDEDDGQNSSSREALRPENLARLSPRVLWSCVYHFGGGSNNNHDNNTNNGDGSGEAAPLVDIIDMYRALLPDCDWSFLRRRTNKLSAKARENQRQEEQKQKQHAAAAGGGGRSNDDDDRIDLNAAVNAIHAIEDAMEHLHDHQVLERQQRMAQAAEARLRRQEQQQDEATRWSLTTPSEPDRDELRECIESSVPPELLLSKATATTTTDNSNNISGDNKNTINSSLMTSWITTLMRDCQIHNWRELAMVQDDEVITRIASRLTGTNDSSSGSGIGIDKQYVHDWIDHAQSESVGEIMVEICDGNVDAAKRLEDQARSSTPKDLAAWRAIPDLLLSQLQPSNNADNNNNDNDDVVTIDVNMLTTWCNRSYNLLQDPSYAWLSWFATTVQ